MHRAHIGWHVASAVTGEIHDNSSEGKHTEGTGETRGFEPLAWIHQRSARGGESRRCLLLAGNRGNLPGAARDRFVRARAATQVHEAIPSDERCCTALEHGGDGEHDPTHTGTRRTMAARRRGR